MLFYKKLKQTKNKKKFESVNLNKSTNGFFILLVNIKPKKKDILLNNFIRNNKIPVLNFNTKTNLKHFYNLFNINESKQILSNNCLILYLPDNVILNHLIDVVDQLNNLIIIGSVYNSIFFSFNTLNKIFTKSVNNNQFIFFNKLISNNLLLNKALLINK